MNTIIKTSDSIVTCSGLDLKSAHPIIYLALKEGGARCPYCSVEYKPSNKAAEGEGSI